MAQSSETNSIHVTLGIVPLSSHWNITYHLHLILGGLYGQYITFGTGHSVAIHVDHNHDSC